TYGAGGGNILALTMGVPDQQKDRVLAAVKRDIAAANGHLDTGIFGTHVFFETLADYGLNDLAFEAMNKHTQPSFGYWIAQGATTTWEHWNGSGPRNHPLVGGGPGWVFRTAPG